MTKTLGVIMDPIATIKPYKDTTFAMLLAAQQRRWPIYYMTQSDVFAKDGKAYANMQAITVRDNNDDWFDLQTAQIKPLTDCDIVMMRKDPPFDMEYIYTTYLLDLAEQAGVRVVNKPQSLRDANEKCFITLFPQCTPPTLITRKHDQVKQFLAQHQHIVVKPLDGMGGKSIFQLKQHNPNMNVILETISHDQTRFIMAQQYLAEIADSGDKRILLINGQPIEYALARHPAADDFRGNLATGGHGEVVPINDRDRWLCQQLAPTLQQKGIVFAGIDVIGDYVTEINITSPTCIREIDAECQTDIAGQLLDQLI